jgi:hypothetical protein
MTPTQSHALMQAVNEVAKLHADEPFDIDTSGKFRDGQGNPMAVAIGRKSKKVTPLNLNAGGDAQSAPNAAVPPGGLQSNLAQAAPAPAQPAAAPPAWPGWPNWPGSALAQQAAAQQPTQPAQGDAATPQTPTAKRGGGITFAPPEKAERPDTQSLLPSEFQGQGGGPIVWNKNTQEATELPLPKGAKRALTTEQTQRAGEFQTHMAETHEARAAREGGAKRVTASNIAKIVDTKGKALKDALTEYKKAVPDDLTKQPDKDAAQETLIERYQEAQKEYEEAIEAETGNPIPHNDWADQMYTSMKASRAKRASDAAGQTPQGAQPAQGAQGGAAKVFPRARIAAYAQANKITPAAAESALTSMGWQVQ